MQKTVPESGFHADAFQPKETEMPDIPEMLSNAERKVLADRLWRVISMCDAGRSISDIRGALRLTAHAVEDPSWDRLADKMANA